MKRHQKLEAAGIADDRKGWLFRTLVRGQHWNRRARVEDRAVETHEPIDLRSGGVEPQHRRWDLRREV